MTIRSVIVTLDGAAKLLSKLLEFAPDRPAALHGPHAIAAVESFRVHQYVVLRIPCGKSLGTSASKRVATSRRKLAAAGSAYKTFRLSPAAAKALRKVSKRRGTSETQAINDLLVRSGGRLRTATKTKKSK